MGNERETVTTEELLRQDLKELTAHQRRWLIALINQPRHERLLDFLREIFYAGEENRQKLNLNFQRSIEAIIEDQIVTILSDEKNFTIGQREFIQKNMGKFNQELSYLALLNAEHRQEAAANHLTSIKSQIPTDRLVGKEDLLVVKINFDEVFKEARLLAQRLNAVDPNKVMFRKDYLDFRKRYLSLPRREQLVIKREMQTRKKRKNEQFAKGCSNLDSVIS